MYKAKCLLLVFLNLISYGVSCELGWFIPGQAGESWWLRIPDCRDTWAPGTPTRVSRVELSLLTLVLCSF